MKLTLGLMFVHLLYVYLCLHLYVSIYSTCLSVRWHVCVRVSAYLLVSECVCVSACVHICDYLCACMLMYVRVLMCVFHVYI